MELRVDSEFRALIPPLTSEERNQLEENLLQDGCRDPLVVWQGILLDGHNRYEICTRRGLPFLIEEMDFSSRDEALAWMIRNQFGRRNLTHYQRSELALRLEGLYAEQAKERQLAELKQNKPTVVQNSAQRDEKGKTRDKIAELAGVSHDTISKVRAIQREAPEAVQEAARSNVISINKGFELTKKLRTVPEAQRDEAARKLLSPEVEAEYQAYAAQVDEQAAIAKKWQKAMTAQLDFEVTEENMQYWMEYCGVTSDMLPMEIQRAQQNIDKYAALKRLLERASVPRPL